MQTTSHSPSSSPDAAIEPVTENARSSRHLFYVGAYVTILLLLLSVASNGIAGVPMQFVLKDQLKLAPTQLALFGVISGAPAYIGFVFGFLRDHWRPLGKGDRGYFLFLPLLLAITCFYMSFGPFTYARLLWVSVVQGPIGLLLGAAAYGLTTTIAQRNGMTGRLSVVMLVVPTLVGMASNAIGGHFSHTAALQHRALFLSGLMCLPMIVLAFWQPRTVFGPNRIGDVDDARAEMRDAETTSATSSENMLASLKRLARTRSIYLPAAAMFLWAFAPGWGTPLFYYLTNKVKLSEVVFGNSQALMGFGVLGATLAYMFLCNKIPLRVNLIIGTLLGVIGCPLFLLIHNAFQANVVSILAGASCGIAVCTYRDLLIRCCPEGLEGAAFLFTSTAGSIAGAVSDLFGSWLYEKGGFGLALAVTTVTTALIFCVIPFIPHALLAPREGERIVPPKMRPRLEDGRAELA